MFYHPHFCCHCGEKIVRAKWTPLTSRRFCEFCAIEQKQHDLIPRAAAVILLLVGAAGFTAYLSSGTNATVSDTSESGRIRKLRTEVTQSDQNVNSGNASRSNISSPGNNGPQQLAANTPTVENKQLPSQRNSSTEPTYYCRAMTKKGTACTRRVKAPGRCWQHLGQPSMNSPQN
jgi:hypothetical protein